MSARRWLSTLLLWAPALGKWREPTPVPAEYDMCAGQQVQEDLRYDVSTEVTSAGVPVYVDKGESLASAVCCDSRTLYYAEPRNLYADLDFFSKLDAGEATDFYDSVCGLPVFVAPVNRSFADFVADTEEHGWPSFREHEVYFQNVVTDVESGLVKSTCGTHLGSFLPDDEGDRWCIDLACIAGNPVPPDKGDAPLLAEQ